MAPSIKYLAAGVTVLMAAFIQHADAGDKVTAKDTTICLLSFNKARAAKLDVRESVLETKSDGTDAQTAALATLNAPNDNTTCELKSSSYPATEDVAGFLYVFKGKAADSLTKEDCDKAVQEQIEAALKQIGDNNTKPFKANEEPYTNENTAAQNFGYMMDEKATHVQCAVTNNCVDKNSIMVCRFTPAIDTSKGVVPFQTNFYEAVKARNVSGVTISQLTESNIGQPLTASGSANIVATASAVILSILGLLTV